jgi:hypothetical protein
MESTVISLPVSLLVLAGVFTALPLAEPARGQAPSNDPRTSQPRGDHGGVSTARDDGPPRAETTNPSPNILERPSAKPPKITGADQVRPSINDRFMVRDSFDNCVVARFHGRYNDKTALILPDGELGFWNRLVPTSEPFRPFSSDRLETLLLDGPYAEYSVLKTAHYLIF